MHPDKRCTKCGLEHIGPCKGKGGGGDKDNDNRDKDSKNNKANATLTVDLLNAKKSNPLVMLSWSLANSTVKNDQQDLLTAKMSSTVKANAVPNTSGSEKNQGATENKQGSKNSPLSTRPTCGRG